MTQMRAWGRGKGTDVVGISPYLGCLAEKYGTVRGEY